MIGGTCDRPGGRVTGQGGRVAGQGGRVTGRRAIVATFPTARHIPRQCMRWGVYAVGMVSQWQGT